MCVCRALAEFTFQRTKLQEICHQFFEWPSEKTGITFEFICVCLLFLVVCICSHCAETFVEPTFFFFLYLSDEYILPKIAERKLRRYAILQSRSTEVGVNRPLHKVSFSLSLQVICYRSLSPTIGLSVEATT